MGLKFYSKDINNSKSYLSLSSNGEQPVYVNTSVSYYKTYHCSSGLLPFKQNSIKEPDMDKHTYASIQNRLSLDRSTQSSCYYSQNNIYANVSKLKNISNEKSIQTTRPQTQIIYENSNYQQYENIQSSPKLSLSTIPLKLNELICYENLLTNNGTSRSSPHIYMNLSQNENQLSTNTSISSEKRPCSTTSPIENKQIDIDTSSNTKIIQVIEKIEVNLAPTCRDKSVLYRTKMPNFTTSIPSSFRQRRRSHRSKRQHQRNTRSSQINSNSHLIQQKHVQHSKLHFPTPPPIVANNRLKQSFSKVSLQTSPSNQLYQEIEQSIVSNDQSEHNSIYSDGETCRNPRKSNDKFEDQVFAWCPGEDDDQDEELTVKFSFTTESEDSDEEDQTSEEDDEELCRHETFEDFFLRRPPKSPCSAIIHHDTSPVISETISQEIPIKSSRLDNRAPSIALGLDKNDVDFIHNIIERSYGDPRRSNRIIALREAYIRALNKRNDLVKTKTIQQKDDIEPRKPSPMKRSVVASKVRDELEKYDVLPIHKMSTFDDNDSYSSSYHHQQQQQQRTNHCTIPAVISTAHRILNFVISLKRQVQKNFREIRSRMTIENTAQPSRHRSPTHNSSGLSHRHRSRSIPTNIIVHSKQNNHHSTEHSHSYNRHKFYRTQSNRSQLQTPNQRATPEQRISYRPRTFRVIAHRQRLPRIG